MPTRKGLGHGAREVGCTPARAETQILPTTSSFTRKGSWRGTEGAYTLLRNELDIDAAKDQLGHADWRVTDRHYTPKQITRPDRSSLIETFARSPNE